MKTGANRARRARRAERGGAWRFYIGASGCRGGSDGGPAPGLRRSWRAGATAQVSAPGRRIAAERRRVPAARPRCRVCATMYDTALHDPLLAALGRPGFRPARHCASVGRTIARPWSRADDRTAQVVHRHARPADADGVILYFALSPITSEGMRDMGAAMANAGLRFWTVEHPFGMLLGLALAHIGRARIRKATDAAPKHRVALIFFTLAMLVILAVDPVARTCLRPAPCCVSKDVCPTPVPYFFVTLTPPLCVRTRMQRSAAAEICRDLAIDPALQRNGKVDVDAAVDRAGVEARGGIARESSIARRRCSFPR